MASLDFNLEKKVFLEFYDSNLTKLLGFVEKIVTVLQSLVKELPESDGFMVLGRVKDKNECIEKFIRKYKNDREKNQKIYTIKDSISDLVGFRIVCIYVNQIDLIQKALIDEFEMLEETNKIEQIQATENTFGYQALHMDMKLSQNYLQIREYKQFSELQFEIQIRTIIQDAWSVVDHKIKYKKEIPLTLKRKINVLSALFELADREFMSIKNENAFLIQSNTQMISNAITNQNPSNLGLDIISFTGFLRNKFPDATFKAEATERFFNELQAIDTELTLTDLISFYDTFATLVGMYQKDNNLDFNAFTFLRYLFVFADQGRFDVLLRAYQKTKLNQWLVNKKPPP